MTDKEKLKTKIQQDLQESLRKNLQEFETVLYRHEVIEMYSEVLREAQNNLEENYLNEVHLFDKS